MLKLYGTVHSRSARCLWALEELGLTYEHIPTAIADTRKPEHLKLNPNGHIPVLDDNGFIIWESLAINIYLAEKYGKAPFYPSDAQGHARAVQWSLWAMTELESHFVTIFRARFAPSGQGDEQGARKAAEALKAPFAVLEGVLKGHDYLLGNDFTIVDLNVAAVAGMANLVQLDLSGAPAVQKWIARCTGRPANQKVQTMK
jgi:glutathione S-transferase